MLQVYSTKSADERRSSARQSHVPSGIEDQSSDDALTAREIEVLIWIARGKSDWEIGEILQISSKTVNFHVENAKRKFGVTTRVQAVVLAICRHGFD